MKTNISYHPSIEKVFFFVFEPFFKKQPYPWIFTVNSKHCVNKELLGSVQGHFFRVNLGTIFI